MELKSIEQTEAHDDLCMRDTELVKKGEGGSRVGSGEEMGRRGGRGRGWKRKKANLDKECSKAPQAVRDVHFL